MNPRTDHFLEHAMNTPDIASWLDNLSDGAKQVFFDVRDSIAMEHPVTFVMSVGDYEPRPTGIDWVLEADQDGERW
jgi:hypothetical protein